MTTNDPWELAESLGLKVTEHGGRHRSGYDPGERIIRLAPGMRGRIARSVLAHEIAHHALGHRPTSLRIPRERQEYAANSWAAQALITPEAYAAAEQIRGGHVPSLAVDLNVSEELVVIYRSQLLRTDTAVYVRPGIGIGQWQHRQEVA